MHRQRARRRTFWPGTAHRNASHRNLALCLVHAAAEGADVRSGFVGAAEQLLSTERCLSRSVFFFNATAAAGLAQMFTQELAGPRIEQPYMPEIPLHLHASADPSRRRAVISGLDFHAAVQMNRALSILVVPKDW